MRRLELVEKGTDWSLHTSPDAETAHPFVSETREDGSYNHPAIDLVLFPGRVGEIPEVQAFPTLGKVLTAANARFSLLRSTACDAKLIEVAAPTKNGGYPKVAGAWVQLAYRLDWHNQDVDKLLSLARMIQNTIFMPDQAFAIRYIVSPFRSWYGREDEGFHGLGMEFAGKGHDADSAWLAATEGGERVAAAVAKVATSEALLLMG